MRIGVKYAMLEDLRKEKPHERSGELRMPSRIGGLGGAIAEWQAYSRHGSHRPDLLSFSVAVAFVHDRASQSDARREAGLTVDNVVAGVMRAFDARSRN